jgi:hypothetical protein
VETNNRQKYSHHPSQHPSSRGTATTLVRFSLPSTSILSIFILQASFSHPRMHESMLALSSRRTYDCHLKECERSLTFLLLFLQEWPVVWHLVRKTSQAISPLLSSVILALYVSLLSIPHNIHPPVVLRLRWQGSVIPPPQSYPSSSYAKLLSVTHACTKVRLPSPPVRLSSERI